MANHIAAIHMDPKSDFGVSFPNFPGCVSAGKTLDEAKDMAQEALSLHIEGMMREDGDPIPGPSDFEAVVENPDHEDAVAFLVVSVPDLKDRAVRVNVTIPEVTLRKIAAAARSQGLSRSSLLVQAARSAMKPARRAASGKGGSLPRK